MKLYLGCLLAVLCCTGCGGDSAPTEQSSTTATVNAENPQDVAVHFFVSLLQHNDVKEAQKYATGSVGRVMGGYASARTYARNVLNMNFDEVEISVDTSNQSVREFYKDRTTVILNFIGMKDGGKVHQFREVIMLEEKGEWRVGEIKADPFARSAI
jgi:hypothetical protein